VSDPGQWQLNINATPRIKNASCPSQLLADKFLNRVYFQMLISLFLRSEYLSNLLGLDTM